MMNNTISAIHIHTQYKENYSDDPINAPYWKFKGGSTYVVTGFSLPLNDGLFAAGEAIVNAVRSQIEYANPMSEEYIIDWEFAHAAAVTEDEAMQLKYDGRIDYPSKRITYDPLDATVDMMAANAEIEAGYNRDFNVNAW